MYKIKGENIMNVSRKQLKRMNKKIQKLNAVKGKEGSNKKEKRQ